MIKKNKLDKLFGPAAIAGGGFMLVVGLLVTIFQSFGGLILVAAGAFAAFSTTSTIIDTENKRVKYSSNLFGIIETGNWLKIEPNMKLHVKKSKHVQRVYSRSNRMQELTEKDLRIVLYGANNKELMPVDKFKSPEAAKEELEKLKSLLGLS